MSLSDHTNTLSRWEEAAERAGVIAGQLAQLNNELIALTAEVLDTFTWAENGIQSPEHWLSVMCATSPARARDIVAIARRRGEFPVLEEKMAAGTVSLDQMTVVARNVPASYSDAVSVFVEHATVQQLRRALPKYGFEEPPDEYATPRPGPSGDEGPTLQMGTLGGRFQLRYEADALEGALVEQALREAKDALFTAGHAEATFADAILEVASRSLSTVESGSRRQHYKVLVHLEADGKGWINKQGALPAHLVERITCDGTVRPVWLKNASPVSVGRSMRIVPDRTRKLVEDRDGGCRYPGCPVTRFLENHHKRHWSKGGATDIDELISLCTHHHREHHRGEFTIEGNPNRPDGLIFKARYGWEIEPHIPDPVPPPRHAPPDQQPVRGWTMDSTLYLRPNKTPAPTDEY